MIRATKKDGTLRLLLAGAARSNMTNLRPVHTIITTSLTVATDFAAGCIGFTGDSIQSSILKKSLGQTRGRSSNGRLLTQITASIQGQLCCLFGRTVPGHLFLGKSLQSKQSHHGEKYLTDSLQSHTSS
jgi:hypothetical protein